MDEIWDYIVFELQNPSAAENVTGRVMDDIDWSEYHALIGMPLFSIVDVSGNYRFFVNRNYMVFY